MSQRNSFKWFETSHFCGLYKLFSAIHIDRCWHRCEILIYRNPQREIPISGAMRNSSYLWIFHGFHHSLPNLPLFSTFTSQGHAPSLGLTYKPIGQSWPILWPGYYWTSLTWPWMLHWHPRLQPLDRYTTLCSTIWVTTIIGRFSMWVIKYKQNTLFWFRIKYISELKLDPLSKFWLKS